MKPYPSNITDDLSSVAESLRFICRLRKEDITDNDNLKDSFISGRRVSKVPTSSTDVTSDDRIGDFSVTDTHVYFCVDSSGTAVWKSLLLRNVGEEQGPAFSVYQSVSQSYSSSIWTKVQLQTKEFDTASCFDNATNYRFTPNVAGYYQINGAVGAFSISGSALVAIYKNGLEYKRGQQVSLDSTQVVVSSLVYLNGSTDYVELYLLSSTAYTTGNDINLTYFNGAMVRGA